MKQFWKILYQNHILNCSYTARDDIIAEDIFGKDLEIIRGRKLELTQRIIPALFI